MMQISNLCLSVPGKTLINQLSLAIRPGECWGLLGPNGCGKSSLLHTLSGLQAPEAGEIRLSGQPIFSYTARERAKRVSILLQEYNASFYGTVYEYISLGRYPYGGGGFKSSQQNREIVNAVLVALELAELEKRQLTTLSGGERQRARIAQLIVQGTEMLFLDEPLQHLDLRHQQRVMTSLQELAYNQQKSVLMVLHDPLWAARYCDHVLLLYEGGTTESGPRDEVLTRSSLQNLYQCSLREVTMPEGRYYVPI